MKIIPIFNKETEVIKSYSIRVKGIVQGVGFRPFIFNLANTYEINGNVINDTEGVLIHAEGSEENIQNFIKDISEKSPSLSYIRSCDYVETEMLNFADFSIGKSESTGNRLTFYSPDVAICQECLTELLDSEDRRYKYPFTTCINCGPRFSIVNDLPYDRDKTTMKPFPMCPDCIEEYENFKDRRFHSQPNACWACGPMISLYKNTGEEVSRDLNIILKNLIESLKHEDVLAIKGVGGFHLAVDASNDKAVQKLRDRKKRPFKPFALMFADIDEVKKYYEVSQREEELLISKESPIVLLKKKGKIISDLVSPGLSYDGVMLPYTPFHHLLFENNKDLILIMTSGNISDEPIVFKDDEAFKRLGKIADYILTYNREIIVHGDDSVLFVENNEPYFIRRSRGYVPIPFSSKETPNRIMAVGGDLKNNFAFARNDFIIMSQYLGDMADAYTYSVYKETVRHFIRVFDVEPDVIVSDMHPSYMTTEFADELGQGETRRIKVQHHHAHIASVLEDQGVEEKVIGIAFDGTGYGTDGKLWGSEFLIADRKDFERVGHFSYFPLPGGESAIKDVWKIGLSLLYQAYGNDFPLIEKTAEVEMLVQMIDQGLNSPMTCSIGRIFDGISSLLGISKSISTEAEAAILLEESAFAADGEIEPLNIPFAENEFIIIKTEELVKYIVSLIKENKSINEISLAFHKSIAVTSVEVTSLLRERTGINSVALSGGVFHNRILLTLISDSLKAKGFKVYTPDNVPFNDGCIALGQLSIAKELI